MSKKNKNAHPQENSLNGHSEGSAPEQALRVPARAKLAPGVDPLATQSIPQVEAPSSSNVALPTPTDGAKGPVIENGNGNGNGHIAPDSNGYSNGQSKSKGNGHAGTNGNGLKDVRPVKVRVGAAFPGAADGDRPTNGHSTNGHSANGNGNNGRGTVQKARVVHHAGVAQPVQPAAARLRDTDIADLAGLRARLKREEWAYPHAAPRSVHRRSLPYFLMRQRYMRSRSRVGHTRVQVAEKRYGGGGVAGLFLKIMAVLTLVVGLLTLAGMGGFAVAAVAFVGPLPPVEENHGLNVQTTKIYDRNGIPLYDLVDEQTGRRHEVALKDISPWVISATVATEDATFYTNPGISAVGIVRAFTINLGGNGQSGASTITQQVVRAVNLPAEDLADVSTMGKARRKVREIVQAVRFSQYWSKDSILEMYLNENNYGHRAYGIDAAALTYFGKTAKELTLSESALLAGLPQLPTYYDPFENPTAAKARQGIVLGLMEKQGMITHEEAQAATNETLVIREYRPVIQAPHFVYYVKKYLEQKYGPDVAEAGLVVTTTLDLRVQDAAEKVARDRIDELKRQHATNAAIVVMKPGTGEILGMVGSVDYYNQAIDGQVNVATAERQPGSSFKPITYVSAFQGGQYGEPGWTPGTVILDTLTSFPNPGQKPYIPKNYDGKDHGWVTVRESIGNSLNIPAVKAIQFAGVQHVIDTAHAMGIKGLNRGSGWYGLSLTLGGGEVTLLDMANAYSTFANGGMEVDANPILKIEDSQGRIISQVDPDAKSKGQPALDPRLAYMMSSILSDNKARTMEFGPNSPLKLSFTAAAKTGTTDDNRDSWTMGYTPDLTVGVWVGNSNNAEMDKVTGAIGAAVIWHNMMETFYSKPEFRDLLRDKNGNLQTEFARPDGLIRDSACSNKGTITDWFLKEAPPTRCVNYKDPPTNKQVHAAPSTSNGTGRSATPGTRPATRPTPLPGIVYPTPVP